MAMMNPFIGTQFDFESSKIKYLENDGCLVDLDKDESLMFRGHVDLCVMEGCVDVNGFLIESMGNDEKEENEYYSLYSSPYGNEACLVIKCVASDCKCRIHLRCNSHNKNNENENFDPIFRINGCYFIYHASILLKQPFLKSLNLSQNNEIYQKQKRLYNECPPLFVCQSWKNCLNFVSKDINNSNVYKPTIMVCARVQTGKSTFTRFAVNHLLNYFDEIAYLDTDVGQSEFTPQGMVTLSIISNPLFGPAFTHQHFMQESEPSARLWKSYYFGESTASDNAGYYLNCVLKLYNEWKNEKNKLNIPLIINTHGWSFGLGATVMKQLIYSMNPNHLIEIEWESVTRDKKSMFKSDEFDNIGQMKDIFVKCNSNSNHCAFDWTKNRDIDEKGSNLNENENKNEKEKEMGMIENDEANSLIFWWKQLIEKHKNENKNSLSLETISNEMKFEKHLNSKQKYWKKYLNDIENLFCEYKIENGKNGKNETDLGKWYEKEQVSMWNQENNKKRILKNENDLLLFLAFFNANVHYVASIQSEYNRCNDREPMTKQQKPQKLTKMRAQRQITSNHKRILNTVCYFTKTVFLHCDPALYLSQMKCYQVPINSVALSLMNGLNFDESMILDAINGTLIGLCCANLNLNLNDMNVTQYDIQPPKKKRKLNQIEKNDCEIDDHTNVIKLNVVKPKGGLGLQASNNCIECVGLAIIRGINLKEKLFYVLTPVEPSLLNKVDLFVRGSTVLPAILLNDSTLLNPVTHLNGISPSHKVAADRVLTAMS